ncbi:MAG: lytic transglycosylase domain-containing protein [Lentisphaerae bacterium]|nr:lytic transglycosylase domain-containing protein [Lentisphaerota bacterium]
MIRPIVYTALGLVFVAVTCASKLVVQQEYAEPLFVEAVQAIRADSAPQPIDEAYHAATPFEQALPRMREIFAETGVPTMLVWIAEVESSRNPTAVSRAGAVGLFQFMPETARRFGLLTDTCDGRVSPCRSARAAARYLRLLHEQFDSWPLALAAYNAGEGRVSRDLVENDDYTFEDVAPFLPRETRLYVAKVIATIALREGNAFARL